MVRVRAPTSITWPSASCFMITRLASHAMRRECSAEQWPSSSTDWPGCSGSASTTPVHMDDHLIPSARGAGVEVVMEGGFGDDPERIGLNLARRWYVFAR